MDEPGGLIVTILAKLALGGGAAFGIIVTALLLQRQSVRGWLDRQGAIRIGWAALSAYVLMAVTLMLLGYGVAGIEPRGDAVQHYYPEAVGIRDGGLPYVEVKTSYGPLFGVINAGLTSLYDSPMAIILATFLIHCLTVFALMRFADGQMSTARLTALASVYLLQPVAIWHTAFTGSNQSWVALLYIASLALLAGGRHIASGATQMMALIAIKVIALIGTPSLFGYARNKVLFVGGFGVVALIYIGVCLAIGIPPHGGLINEAGEITSSNLPYLATLFGFDLMGHLTEAQIAAFGALAIAALYTGFRAPPLSLDALAAGGAGLLFVFLLSSPKAYTIYMVMMHVPVALWMARHIDQQGLSLRVLVYAGVMVLAAVNISLWFTLMDKATLEVVWTATGWQAPLFLVCQLAQIGGYLYLGTAAFRDFNRLRA